MFEFVQEMCIRDRSAIDANDAWYYIYDDEEKNREVTSGWRFPVGVSFTVEESDELDEIAQNIPTFVSESFASFLTGSQDIDDDAVWEQYKSCLLYTSGRYFYLKDWFDHAFEAGLSDFDVIGLSYYPFWHGTFNDLKETTKKLIQDFKKPIILAETAHAWRKSKNGFIDEAQEKIAGFAASPLGQRMVLDMDNTIMASLPDKMGRGIYYWEPLCIPRGDEGGWAENMGILDAVSYTHLDVYKRQELHYGTSGITD